MHLPDGFLDAKTLVSTTVLSVSGLSVAWTRVTAQTPPQRVPLLGIAAAFVFAAQMLNFPVVGGTSGHLMGSVLIAILVGPYAAIIAMSAVLLVQCFLFADGGLLSLGANIFNMAIVGVVVGYTLYRALRRFLHRTWGMMVAAALASWVSIVVSALCCAGELAWSGSAPWSAVFAAMGSIHALIGVGEAFITCTVLAALNTVRPELLRDTPGSTRPAATPASVMLGSICVLGVLLFVSPFASEWPDGLESVAETLGFSQRALHIDNAPGIFSDYRVPGVPSTVAATVLAGAMGIGILCVLTLILRRTVRRP